MFIKKKTTARDGKNGKDRRDEFAEFCGVWTSLEADQFLESIADLETIDGRKPTPIAESA
jgi:hypothetical protein